MANAFRGEIGITHDGISYTLVLDFNALCDFEGETGKNALTVLEGMETGGVNASDLRALMWAALRQNHPDMTLALAGQILSRNVDAIGKLSGAMMPEPDALGNVPGPRKPRAGKKA